MISRFPILREHFFLLCNVGSILLDPSLTQSLEDSQAFIDLFPDSATLNAVFKDDYFQTGTNGNQIMEISDRRNKVLFSK